MNNGTTWSADNSEEIAKSLMSVSIEDFIERNKEHGVLHFASLCERKAGRGYFGWYYGKGLELAEHGVSFKSEGTSYRAEYAALEEGLRKLVNTQEWVETPLLIRGDSAYVIDSMRGDVKKMCEPYLVKAKERCLDLLGRLGVEWTIERIPRERNQGAVALAEHARREFAAQVPSVFAPGTLHAAPEAQEAPHLPQVAPESSTEEKTPPSSNGAVLGQDEQIRQWTESFIANLDSRGLLMYRETKRSRQQRVIDWAAQFEMLRSDLRNDNQRITTVLAWYGQNMGGLYIPEAYSGKSFRKKFIAIEAAMRRKGQQAEDYERKKQERADKKAETAKDKPKSLESLMSLFAYAVALLVDEWAEEGFKSARVSSEVDPGTNRVFYCTNSAAAAAVIAKRVGPMEVHHNKVDNEADYSIVMRGDELVEHIKKVLAGLWRGKKKAEKQLAALAVAEQPTKGESS